LTICLLGLSIPGTFGRGGFVCLGCIALQPHRADQPMIDDFLTRLYVCGIIVMGICLFLAVDEFEPNQRLAVVLKDAILAIGGAAIIDQLA